MTEQILKVLKQYWGYDSLRDGQLEILESVLSGRDTIAILPTGGGKSLCFQLPALLNQTVTLVISPLLALMKDQAHHLVELGIKTICLNSELKPLDQIRVLNSLASYQIIYVTPEFLLSNPKVITNLVETKKLGMLAIDEAHCASSWGHDFRPSYLRLGDIKEKGLLSPGIPILALTATAPPSVINDIAKILRLEKPNTIIGDLGRKNLIIKCMKKTNTKNPAFDLYKLIDSSQNTIIYTIKRDETDLI
ncbi:MAG: RecQ family ATP-dependent DNA helicase, partial [Candidatus Paceibacterota bacterium]